MEAVSEYVALSQRYSEQKINSSTPLRVTDKIDLFKKAIDRMDEAKRSLLSLNEEPLESRYEETKLDLPEKVYSNKNLSSRMITDRDVLRWKGYVTEIGKDTFTSNLYELNKNGTYEVGIIQTSNVEEDDVNLLKIGAIFYLSVGSFKGINGTSQNRMVLKFQRIIDWTAEEYDEAIDKASEYSESTCFSNLNESRH